MDKITYIVSSKKNYADPDFMTFLDVLVSVFDVSPVTEKEYEEILKYYSGFGNSYNYLYYIDNKYVFECSSKYKEEIRKLCSVFRIKIEEEFSQ